MFPKYLIQYLKEVGLMRVRFGLDSPAEVTSGIDAHTMCTYVFSVWALWSRWRCYGGVGIGQSFRVFLYARTCT